MTAPADTDPTPPDVLIVSAANDTQAAGYRAHLDARRKDGRLPRGTRVLVAADPGGRRIGSGGSTLLALARLLRDHPGPGRGPGPAARRLAGRRIFLLHAGGDCRRLPAYAAQGKLFTPLPCRTRPGGPPATLFDLLLDHLARLPAPAAGHVLVACGDVLVTFNPRDVRLDRPGVTGVAYPDAAERSARHGVYVLDDAGRVRQFLQKPPPDELKAHRAVSPTGQVLIDTGLINFDLPTADALLAATGFDPAANSAPDPADNPQSLLGTVARGEAAEIDLYEEIALALTADVSPDDYDRRVLGLPRNAGPARADHRRRLRDFARALRGLPFHADILPYCDFFHLGSSREALAGLAGRSRTAAACGFAHAADSVLPDAWPADRAFAFNTVVTGQLPALGPAVLVEGCHVAAPVALAGRNILTGLPATVTRPVRLPEGMGLVVLPVGPADDWAAVVYGLDDDFRTSLPSGTFLNSPLGSFLDQHALTPADLWPDGADRTLYSARLWAIGSADDATQHFAWMLGDARPEVVSTWRHRRRFALAELMPRVDHTRLLAHRAELHRLAALHQPFARLAADPDGDAAVLVGRLASRAEAAAMLDDLAAGCSSADPALQARVLQLASLALARALELPADPSTADPSADARLDAACRRLLGRPGTPEDLAIAAAAAVACAVARHVAPPASHPRAAVSHDQVVWVTAPARLDFAGGWSDTPPICTDRGGCVVNAAVKLNGQYPIQAIAKLHPEPVLTLTSIDLGRRETYDRIEQLHDHADPSRWSSLPRAALCLAGLAGGRTAGDLRDVLVPFGGGLDLTLFSALPQGSGLGASSILGAALLQLLARLTGEPLARDRLIARTSLLEQVMTTGGGWQDQVGAVLPGVKLTRTQAGPDQTPAVFWLAFDDAFARGRLLLYWTGLRRLAKNILQQVVRRYLARDRTVLDTIARLKDGALALREAIDTRDYDGFARGLADYWRLKQRIDPGSTTPAVEALLARAAPHCAGATLLGAGGGGFVLLAARDEAAADRLRADLSAHPSHPGARFFDFTLDPQGLSVSVL